MKIIVSILMLCLFVLSAAAQTETEETLLQKLADAPNDSMRAETYISLHNITFISDLNKSREYAKQVVAIGLKTVSFKFIQKGYYELSRCGRKRRDYYNEVMPNDFLMLKYAKQANSSDDIFNAYRLIATDYIDDEKPSKSLPYIDTCRQVISHLSNPSYTGRVNQLYGWYYSEINQSRQSIPFFRNALSSYQLAGDDKMVGELEYGLGDCFLNIREPDSACVYTYKAIEIFKKRKSVGRQADCYGFLGKCYTLNGNIEKGIESYLTCIELQNQVFDSVAASLAYIDLARLYLLKKDTASGLASAREAGNRIQKLNYPLCNVELNTFWGQYFLAVNQFDQANEYFSKASILAVQNNLTDNKIEIEKYWAQLRYKQNKNKDGDSLVYSYVKQLLASKEPNTINREVATLLKRNPHLDSSTVATIKLLYSPGGADFLKKKLGIQGLSSVSNMDSVISLNPYSLATEIFDSSVVVSDNRQLMMLETQYKTRLISDSLKLEKQNAQVAKAEVQRRNAVLTGTSIGLLLLAAGFYLQYRNRKRAERDKAKIEMLQNEIHHRVKNNLGVINRLIEVAGKGGTDNVPLQALQTRVKAIELLHKRLYNDNLTGNISLQEYLLELTAAIQNMFDDEKKLVAITVNAPVEVSSKTAEKIGLIINELVTNSYKYAFDETQQGHIRIEAQPADAHEYKLMVADNGKGFTTGKKKSYGMKLIAGLSRELGGSYAYVNDAGTQFNLTFKDNV